MVAGKDERPHSSARPNVANVRTGYHHQENEQDFERRQQGRDDGHHESESTTTASATTQEDPTITSSRREDELCATCERYIDRRLCQGESDLDSIRSTLAILDDVLDNILGVNDFVDTEEAATCTRDTMRKDQ